MSKIDSISIFKSGYFWIITISILCALVVIFAFPYLFDSFQNLLLRLFIASLIFFGTLTGILMYTLLVKDEVKDKIRNVRKQFKKKKEYSGAIAERIQDLKTRFNEAMHVVKSSSIYKNKKIAGYELPWYLLVGAENEGKTALLENSGLDFPLNINYKKRTVTEDGPSQSFQWYFAEHAIFIDMPGSFIDASRRDEDMAVWESFLKLFSKKRWKRPINGIALTVSVDTLMGKNERELEEYAKDLRDRFDEISRAFVSNIPIYLIVTKMDKITGFKEYFADISDKEKDEILGVTFENTNISIDTSVIQPELNELLKRLNSTILDKINKEWDTNARSKILLFCNEFAALFQKLNTFIEIGFSQTRYRKPLMLRGIYFTAVPANNTSSDGQEFEKSSLAMAEPEKGMFIQKLLTDIIFPESNIIKMDTSYKKSRRIKHIAALAISILLVSSITIYWIQDFNSRLDLLDNTQKILQKYDSQRAQITSQADFKDALKSLNLIYNLKKLNEKDQGNAFWKIAYFKVPEQNKMLDKLYQESLRDILLPRVAKLIEDQIKANIGDYDLTWESMKAYSMLKNEQHRDNDFLKAWLATAWSHLYPNMNATQNDLNEHLSNLLTYGFKPYKLNKEVVQLARNQLLKYGPEALVYKELKDEAKEKNLQDFRFSTALGSYASAFEGSDYTIPGFYTKKGYEDVIIADGKALIKRLVANNWVVGYSTQLSDSELDEMYAKVQNYYFIDYKKYWMEALSSLKVPEYKSISELNNQLTVLTSGMSPIIGVLEALKKNTMIYTPAEKLQIKIDKNLKERKAASIASQNALEQAQKITDNTSVKNIREYFAPYNRLINEQNQPTPKLATAMLKLNSVYQEMTAIYGSVTPEKDAYNIVINRIAGKHAPIVMQISSLPRPIDRWFKRALKNDWNYLLSRTKKYITNQFHLNVFGYYTSKIKGRYPLSKHSRKNDIRTQDFEEFFKKHGILDTFYERYVAPFVNLDTLRGTYRYRTIDGSNLYINKRFMQAMLAAVEMRKMFFTSQGDTLGTYFYIKPHALGRKLSRMDFYYDENDIAYQHGPIKTRKVIWPPESLNNIAKFAMYDLHNNRVIEISSEGEWALFKLIEQFNIKYYKKHRGADSILIRYQKNYYNGSFDISGAAIKTFTKESPLRKFKLGSSL